MGGWRSEMLPRPLGLAFTVLSIGLALYLAVESRATDLPRIVPWSTIGQIRLNMPLKEVERHYGKRHLDVSWDNGLQRRRPNGAGSLLEGGEPGVPSLLGLNEKRLLPDAGWGWRGDSDSARLVPPDTIQPLSAPLAVFRVRRECAGLARRDSRRRLSDDDLPRDAARARRQRNPADQGWRVTQGSWSSVESS